MNFKKIFVCVFTLWQMHTLGMGAAQRAAVKAAGMGAARNVKVPRPAMQPSSVSRTEATKLGEVSRAPQRVYQSGAPARAAAEEGMFAGRRPQLGKPEKEAITKSLEQPGAPRRGTIAETGVKDVIKPAEMPTGRVFRGMIKESTAKGIMGITGSKLARHYTTNAGSTMPVEKTKLHIDTTKPMSIDELWHLLALNEDSFYGGLANMSEEQRKLARAHIVTYLKEYQSQLFERLSSLPLGDDFNTISTNVRRLVDGYYADDVGDHDYQVSIKCGLVDVFLAKLVPAYIEDDLKKYMNIIAFSTLHVNEEVLTSFSPRIKETFEKVMSTCEKFSPDSDNYLLLTNAMASMLKNVKKDFTLILNTDLLVKQYITMLPNNMKLFIKGSDFSDDDFFVFEQSLEYIYINDKYKHLVEEKLLHVINELSVNFNEEEIRSLVDDFRDASRWFCNENLAHALKENLRKRVLNDMAHNKSVAGLISCILEYKDSFNEQDLQKILANIKKTDLTKITPIDRIFTGVLEDILEHQEPTISRQFILNNPEDTYNLLTANKALIQPVQESLRLEKEHPNHYFVYHGQDSRFMPRVRLYTDLLRYRLNDPNLPLQIIPEKYSVGKSDDDRGNWSTSVDPDSDEYYDKYLEKQHYINTLRKDTEQIHGEVGGHESEKTRLLFTTPSILSSTNKESPRHFFSENRSWTGSREDLNPLAGADSKTYWTITLRNVGIKNADELYNKYERELNDLLDRNLTLSNQGNIYAIGIPKEKIDRLVIPINAGAEEPTYKVNDSREYREKPHILFEALKYNPESITDVGEAGWQPSYKDIGFRKYRVNKGKSVILGVPVLGGSGLLGQKDVIIESLRNIKDPNALQKWEQDYQNLLTRIKADIEKLKSEQDAVREKREKYETQREHDTWQEFQAAQQERAAEKLPKVEKSWWQIWK